MINNLGDAMNKVDNLGRTLLHSAVIEEDIELLDALINSNMDLNIKDINGCTAMHLAVKKGRVEFVDRLIQGRADINLKDKANWTALTYACDGCYEEIVRLLLSSGIVIDAISLEIAVASAQNIKELGGIILDYLKYECNRRILDAFYDLDRLKELIVPLKPLYRLQENEILCVSEITMKTWILEEANRTNNKELLKILLKNGIELDLDKYNASIFSIVCDFGGIGNVKILLDKDVPINRLNERIESCLFIAARNNDMPLMKLLLSRDISSIINTPNEFGITPLHIACAYANEEMVNELVIRKANIYHKVSLSTLLNYLDSVEYDYVDNVKVSESELKKMKHLYVDSMGVACCLGYKRIVAMLMDRGYDINRPINWGNTALHIASMSNNVSLINYLVKNGANLNARNDAGNTALHVACIGKRSKAVLALIAMGASELICNKYRRMPVHIAYEKNNNVIIRILSNSCNMKYAVKQADIKGVTLLHLACKRLDVDKVRYLLEMGAETNALDIWRNSPLHYIYTCDIAKDRKERVRNILEMLKGKGIDVNMKNACGYSALDMACAQKRIDDVCLLIEDGAEINADVVELATNSKRVNSVLDTIKKRKLATNSKRGDIVLDTINKRKKESDVNIDRIDMHKNMASIQK